MKKISVIISTFLLLALTVSFMVKSESDKKLICDKSGNFTILVVSDPQCDTKQQWHEAQDELETLVKRSNPNLVLINGDMNSYNKISRDDWDIFIAPLENRGIYWCTTNGNHDPFDFKIYNLYRSYKYCLNSTVKASDINYERNRPMNYVLPIYSCDGQRIVFAVYGMDSGANDENGYEGLTVKQINWYKAQSQALKENNGGKAVTSLLCIHIPLPQILEAYYGGESKIYGIANEVKYNLNGYITQKGEKIPKINVHTSSIKRDNKMLDIILNQGDIKAVLFGHNHRNNFVGSYKGVLLGFVGKLSSGCYSDTLCRGGRVIRFNESQPQIFTTEWLSSFNTEYDQPPIYSDGGIAKDELSN